MTNMYADSTVASGGEYGKSLETTSSTNGANIRSATTATSAGNTQQTTTSGVGGQKAMILTNGNEQSSHRTTIEASKKINGTNDAKTVFRTRCLDFITVFLLLYLFTLIQ